MIGVSMMVRVANLPQGRCLDFEVAFLGERRLTLIHSIWRLGSILVLLFLLVVVLAMVKVLLVELEHFIHCILTKICISYSLQQALWRSLLPKLHISAGPIQQVDHLTLIMILIIMNKCSCQTLTIFCQQGRNALLRLALSRYIFLGMKQQLWPQENYSDL